MSTLKEAYEAHKKNLKNTIEQAIKGFEVNTGCKVTVCEAKILEHFGNSFSIKDVEVLLTDIHIETNIDGRYKNSENMQNCNQR